MKLEVLVHHTVERAETRQSDARELAEVAHGAACCGSITLLGLLFITLARAAEQRVSEFNVLELANTSWAFAKLNISQDVPDWADMNGMMWGTSHPGWPQKGLLTMTGRLCASFFQCVYRCLLNF